MLLLLIAYFDFKDRTIPVILLLLLSAITIYQKVSFPIYLFQLTPILVNIVILSIQLMLMIGWFKWRNKGSSFFKDAFGWGDVWILYIAAFYFESSWFVWFMIVSGIVSLIYGGVMKKIKPTQEVLIPLAGIVSLLLIIHMYLGYFHLF